MQSGRRLPPRPWAPASPWGEGEGCQLREYTTSATALKQLKLASTSLGGSITTKLNNIKRKLTVQLDFKLNT